MSNYRRANIHGGTYFFTVTTLNRQTFLLDDDVRAALREGIALVRLSHPFTVNAWVLLPDHLHCIWTLPPNDRDFSTRWRVIKRTVTQRCGGRLHRPDLLTVRRAQRKQSTLWQHRYWEHLIRDEQDYRQHVDYIHWNPVKHGHVQRARYWPCSTFHRHVMEGIYSIDWGIDVSIANEGDFGELE